MAFKDIASRLKPLYPTNLSSRYRDQDALLRFLEGTIYDDAKLTPFDMERAGNETRGEYIKLRNRRPSVVSNFARQFVEQTIGLLWMDEQFPVVRCYKRDDPDEQDTDAEKQIQLLIEEIGADEIMSRATYLGSIGSAAIVARGLDEPDGKPWFEVWRGYQCTPKFDPKNPTKLLELNTIYNVSGEALKLAGYTISKDDLSQTFWVRILLNREIELRFKPMRQDRFERLGEEDKGVRIRWEPDQQYRHRFGMVNSVWIKSPNADTRTLDGPCIFGSAVDTIVELDYQLSQIGRAYKYTADPLLAIRRGELNVNQYSPSGSEPVRTDLEEGGAVRRDAGNTIDLEPGGEAKLLEITGKGLTAALDYVQKLREYALESIGGMKSDSETQKGAQSGRALELLYQALVIVVKRLRLAWGNRGLIPLLDLTLRGIKSGELTVPGISLDPDSVIMRLHWPNWMTPTGPDFLATAQAWQLLGGGSATAPVPIFDRETVTRLAATNLGFQDAETLVAAVQSQATKDQAAELEQQDKTLEIQAKHNPQPASGGGN